MVAALGRGGAEDASKGIILSASMGPRYLHGRKFARGKGVKPEISLSDKPKPICFRSRSKKNRTPDVRQSSVFKYSDSSRLELNAHAHSVKSRSSRGTRRDLGREIAEVIFVQEIMTEDRSAPCLSLVADLGVEDLVACLLEVGVSSFLVCRRTDRAVGGGNEESVTNVIP